MHLERNLIWWVRLQYSYVFFVTKNYIIFVVVSYFLLYRCETVTYLISPTLGSHRKYLNYIRSGSWIQTIQSPIPLYKNFLSRYDRKEPF